MCVFVCECLGRGVCVCHAAVLVWPGSRFTTVVAAFSLCGRSRKDAECKISRGSGN